MKAIFGKTLQLKPAQSLKQMKTKKYFLGLLMLHISKDTVTFRFFTIKEPIPVRTLQRSKGKESSELETE